MTTDIEKLIACVCELDDRVKKLDAEVATLETTAVVQALRIEALRLANKTANVSFLRLLAPTTN